MEVQDIVHEKGIKMILPSKKKKIPKKKKCKKAK